MTTSFRIPYQVLQRAIGAWDNGVYSVSSQGTMITVSATVQMPREGDLMQIEATPFGRRAGRYIKIYCDVRLNCANQEIDPSRVGSAGDIFYYDDSEYLLFGESDFTALSKSRPTRVSHWRYYGCETIEHSMVDMVETVP